MKAEGYKLDRPCAYRLCLSYLSRQIVTRMAACLTVWICSTNFPQ